MCIIRMARDLLSFISILFLGELHAMGLLYVLVCCFTSMLFSDLVHAIGLLYVSYEMRRCVLQCFSLCITRNGANVHIVYIIRNRGLCLLYKTPVLLKGIAMFCCITHFFYISFSPSLFLPLSLFLSILSIYLSICLSTYIFLSGSLTLCLAAIGCRLLTLGCMHARQFIIPPSIGSSTESQQRLKQTLK